MQLDLADLVGVRVCVLVEGDSDQAALEALAERHDLRLASEGVLIVPMGGATNIARFARMLGPRGLGIRLAGLCDAGEEGYFSRALGRALGAETVLSRADLEGAGFFVCEADLEDELIRAHGVASVERLLQSQGDLGSFRIFQKQPAQQGRSPEVQLHRFMGTRSGRKRDYARLLSATVDLDRVPAPLARLLEHLV
jgi:hypothetical protein